jgi:hypothetical protein
MRSTSASIPLCLHTDHRGPVATSLLYDASIGAFYFEERVLDGQLEGERRYPSGGTRSPQVAQGEAWRAYGLRIGMCELYGLIGEAMGRRA